MHHQLLTSAGTGVKRFADWEEHFVSYDRGSRVVHYYLKDRNGSASLAVVGTERSLRHMVYVVCDEFLPFAGLDKSTTPAFKWRSRREVVDWLGTFIAKPRFSPSRSDQNTSKSPKHESSMLSDHDMASNGDDTDFVNGSSQDEGRNRAQDRAIRKHLGIPAGDIVWVGAAWSCRKRLRHYQSFQRNFITISVHNFVYVMSEGNGHHIAYIEDMYEDKKSKKKVRVRWFHKIEEVVGTIPLPPPHPREVFITPFPQVLSVECVDGLATVLTPDHYEKCVLTLPADAVGQMHLCFRQFDNEGVKLFNISEVKGYWQQKALTFIDPVLREYSPNCDLASDSMELDEDEEMDIGSVIRRGPRTARCCRRIGTASRIQELCDGDTGFVSSQSESRLVTGSPVAINGFGSSLGEMRPPGFPKVKPEKDGDYYDQASPAFDVGDKVELLCQDSGIRGCWFRCTVIRRIPGRLKVRYEELETEDGHGKLEEWVSSAKVAACDKLGVRKLGRLTMRPSPDELLHPIDCEIGSVVDAWWNDGWWEGFVLRKEGVEEFQVYFPDENDSAAFRLADLRVSRDWFNGQWVDIESNAEIWKFLGVPIASAVSVTDGMQSLKMDCCARGISLLSDDVMFGRDISPSSEILTNASPHLYAPSERINSNKDEGVPTWNKSNVCTEEARICGTTKGELMNNDKTFGKQVESVQCMKSGSYDLESIRRDHGHMPVNAQRAVQEPKIRSRSCRKRQRQLEAVNVPRFKKIGNTSLKDDMESSEDSLAEEGRSNKDSEEALPLENSKDLDRHQQDGNTEGLVKAKKVRQGHENHKPLHSPPIGNSLFINSMPLASLVMSR